MRDTDGIRSILLAALIDERPRLYIYVCIFITILEFTPPTTRPFRSYIDQPRVGSFFLFYIYFFSFFIFRLQRAIDLLYAHGTVDSRGSCCTSLPFCYTMTNTFDKLPFSPLYNPYIYMVIYIYISKLVPTCFVCP